MWKAPLVPKGQGWNDGEANYNSTRISPSTQTRTKQRAFQVTFLTSFSVNVLAFFRRWISSSAGWRQVPGVDGAVLMDDGEFGLTTVNRRMGVDGMFDDDIFWNGGVSDAWRAPED